MKVRVESIGRGGLYLRGDLFEAQNAQYLKDAQTNTIDMEEHTANNPAAIAALEDFKSRHGALDSYYFLPLHGRYQRIMIALRRSDGSIVDTLGIKPPDA